MRQGQKLDSKTRAARLYHSTPQKREKILSRTKADKSPPMVDFFFFEKIEGY
jgi:hypothetical protein